MSPFVGNLVCFLEETLSFVLCYLLIKGLKPSKRCSLIVFFLSAVMFQCVWQLFLPDTHYNLSLPAGFLFPFFCTASSRRHAQRFFLFCVLSETLCYGISVYIITLFAGYDVFKDFGLMQIMSLMPFPVLVIFFYCLKKILLPEGEDILFLKPQRLALLIALVCSVVGLVIHVLMIINKRNLEQNIFISGITFVCITIIYLFTTIWQGRTIWKNQRLQEMQNMYNQITKSQQQYIEDIIQRNQDLRRFRHDLQAHMVILNDMAEKNDCSGIRAYIHDIENTLKKAIPVAIPETQFWMQL